jgi:hypothetical protein
MVIMPTTIIVEVRIQHPWHDKEKQDLSSFLIHSKTFCYAIRSIVFT